MPDRDGWTSPSELAEYTFCPRALHYRQTRGPAPPSRSADAGTAYHGDRLSAERWRAEHPGLPWAVVLVGGLLVVVALLAAFGVR